MIIRWESVVVGLLVHVLVPVTWSSHPCQRECEDGARPMVCYYQFTVEWYYTLSKACYKCPSVSSDCARAHCIPANGVEKAILVVNRQLPGPSIQVCENDTIMVDVLNHAGSETTAIHWHGLHQIGTPYMDGVPMITQCPIPPHNSFRYQFLANPAGTHFWHSHSGLQRSDGVHGSLIIRQSPMADPHRDLYDYDKPEHVILLTDWLSELSFDRFVAHHHDAGHNKPQSILINGKGRFHPFSNDVGNLSYTPVEVLRVEAGNRYRFRVISNGILNCPLQFSVDKHTMTVISADGQPVESVQVDSFVIYAGERFDFILNANKSVDNYWIRVQGLLDCDERFTRASQVAILRYEGAPDEEPKGNISYFDMNRGGRQLNPLNSGSSGEKVAIVDLNTLLPDDATSKKEPDFKYYLPYDFNSVDNKHFHNKHLYPIHAVERHHQLFTPQINDISLMMPSAPLLSQPEATSAQNFCNHTTAGLKGRNCSRDYCECIYTLKVPLNAVVELIVIDKGFTFDANHPIHIHGLAFRVVAMQRVGSNVTLEQVKRMDAENKIQRKLSRAVAKDTVTVPDGGFTIIRFVANNPGYWILHCHIEFHVEIGMGLILHVGEPEDIPHPPPHFPRCGDWPPDPSSLVSHHFALSHHHSYRGRLRHYDNEAEDSSSEEEEEEEEYDNNRKSKQKKAASEESNSGCASALLFATSPIATLSVLICVLFGQFIH